MGSYDGPEIAKIALSEPYHLYVEAFLIYKKCGLNAEAVETLLMNEQSLDHTQEFAARRGDNTVWFKLGKAQLQKDKVVEAVIGKYCEDRDLHLAHTADSSLGAPAASPSWR